MIDLKVAAALDLVLGGEKFNAMRAKNLVTSREIVFSVKRRTTLVVKMLKFY